MGKKQIDEAVQVLKRGGVVVFPTETSYGLAADATNKQAVRRLAAIKGRGRKTLPVIAASLAMVGAYAKMSPSARAIAKKFWPGPLTLVIPVHPRKNSNRTSGEAGPGSARCSGANSNAHANQPSLKLQSASKLAMNELAPQCVKDGRVAIRVSSQPVARKLSEGLGKPIVATSANKAGQPDVYSILSFKRQYLRSRLQPDYILNIGALPRRKPTTIVRIENDQIEMLRQGRIKL